MLIKLSPGDIELGRQTDFAVYSGEGKLLLRKGLVVDSDWLFERLFRLGHREDTSANKQAGTGNHAMPEPLAADNPDGNQPDFGAPKADYSQTSESAIASRKSPSLPNLRQKVEFFHLTHDGGTDALRMELTGIIPDEAIIVRHTSQHAPALATGMVYEARLFTGARIFKFATRLLSDGTGPLGCKFLEYPQVVSHAIVRRHQRVPTSIMGKLRTNEFQRPPTDVMIENVSAIGVGITASEDCLAVGQNARLAMDLPIDGRTRHVVVVVEVRNRRQEDDRFMYGLEILQGPNDAQRDIKDFVVECLADI
ncbi:MAG TPA: PilZ domain-containing protein [Paraburkholderia sp.]|jgi:hypothetical protein